MLSVPSEWATIRLKSVSSPKDHRSQSPEAALPKEPHEPEDSSCYAAVKLRSAPKPTDFCPNQSAAGDKDAPAIAAGGGGGSVYDTIRASLKKIGDSRNN